MGLLRGVLAFGGSAPNALRQHARLLGAMAVSSSSSMWASSGSFVAAEPVRAASSEPFALAALKRCVQPNTPLPPSGSGSGSGGRVPPTPSTPASSSAPGGGSSSTPSGKPTNTASAPPRGFEIVYGLSFDRKAATSVANAVVMTDLERSVAANAVRGNPRAKYARLTGLAAIGLAALLHRLWQNSRVMEPPYAEDGSRRFASIVANIDRHVANFFDAAGHLVSFQYFVDYHAFEADVLAEADPAPLYVAVTTYFPAGPLLLLLLIPFLGFFQDALRMAGRFATTTGAPGPLGDKAKFKFKKEVAIKTRLADVAGMTEAKHEVSEIIDFLKNPMRYRRLGAKVPKGIMMDGPPGVGKTLLAKAIAGEAGLPFLSVAGSEFEEVYVGVGAMRVRELFKQARASRPCVVFIDEIDSFGKKRSGGRDGSRGTLNAFLSEMDGFNESSNILVLAATNRYDVLDGALTRSGRFDRKISLERPPQKDRVAIAKVHLRNLTLDPGLTVDDMAETLATMTPGCSGADIHNICNEAAIIASRENRESINAACFHRAIERVLVGLEKKAKKVPEHERRRVAYHEAGHVVLGWFQTDTDPIIKASIVPRGGDKIGVTQKLKVEAYISTQSVLRQRMIQQLGGYVAEETFFHDLSTSAADDLRSVTDFATHEICTYGMDPQRVGHFHFERDENAVQKPFGPEKEDTIDLAVASVVEASLAAARALLQEHINSVRIVAGLLLRHETLTAQEIWLAIGERPNMSKEFRSFLEA